MAQSYDRRINLYINGREVQNNIASIRKEMFKLTNEQARMTIGSREYQQHAAQIKRLKGIMAQHVQDVNNIKKGWSMQGMASGLNKYFGMVTAALASFAGAALTIKSAVQAFAEFDDKLADVMKTTGLTKDQVKTLNGELKKIDTRSAQTELLDLARVAGKLGITAEDEILGFVRAADKIKVALSEDLGGDVEESINQLGKLVDIFKLKDEFGIEDALIKIGSAINSLGAAGTANEAYMVEFSKRLAGIAPAAGMSIQQVLGLAATLDELGQTSEVSGTAIVQVIGKMFKDTAAYANIAGMSIEDFTTLLNTDANEAFIKLLEGARGSGTGFGEMAKNLQGLGLDGARSTAVLGVLADNIGKLREKQAFSNQEFEKGTSIITEFNTKNESAQAQLEKAKKGFVAMQVELGERLSPAYTSVIHKSSALLKIFGATVEFLFKYGKQLMVVVASIAAYTVATKLAAYWEGTLNKQKGIGLLLTKTGIALNNAASAAMLLYQAAVAALAGNFTKATRAMQLFWAFSKLTPIGLIAGAVTALAGAFIIYSQRMKEATKANKEYNKTLKEEADLAKGYANDLVSQKNNLNALVNSIISVNDNETLRASLIKKLKAEYPDFLKGIVTETISNEQLRIKLGEVNALYSEKIRLSALQAKTQAINNASTKAEERKLEIEDELAQIEKERFKLGNKKSNEKQKLLTDEYKQLNATLEIYKQKSEEAVIATTKLTQQISGFDTVEYYKAQLDGLTKSRKVYDTALQSATEKGNQQEIAHYQQQINLTDNQISLFSKRKAELEKSQPKGGVSAGDDGGNTEQETDLIKLKEKQLEAINAEIAVTPVEIASRNKRAEALQNEINKYKELGTTKQGDLDKKELEEDIKKRIDEKEAEYNADVSLIRKKHLETKGSEDQYNADLLDAELKFLADKLTIYKVGSKEYEETVNKSLELQVTADRQIKDLLLQAEQELATAKIENIQDEIKKQAAAEEQRWAIEKAALKERLNTKTTLSEQEIAYNDTINKIIEEKEAAHQLKMKGLKAGENIPDLENMVEAATPVDTNFAPLDQQQAFFDARLALIQAQYEKEKQLAGENKAALLAADKKYQRDSYQVKSDQIDAEFALVNARIGAAQSYVDMLSSVVDQESALGKALFLFNQALAIGQIWINIAVANAKAAAALVLPPLYAPVVAANIAMGAAQTGIVVAQTVAKFSKSGKKEQGFSVGGPTGDGPASEPAGIVHKGEWVAPKWMLDDPKLAPHIAILEAVRKRKSNAVGLLNSSPDSDEYPSADGEGAPAPPTPKIPGATSSGNPVTPSNFAIAALKTFSEKRNAGPSTTAVKTFSSGGYTSDKSGTLDTSVLRNKKGRFKQHPYDFGQIDKAQSMLIEELVAAIRGGSNTQQENNAQPTVNFQVNTDPAILAKLDQLNTNIANLKIYTAIEDIKKGDKKYTEIQSTRGL